MNITIKIENCESIGEFYAHLTDLRRQIKKEAKRLKLNPLNDEFPSKGVDLDYMSCYGEHYVKIKHPRI